MPHPSLRRGAAFLTLALLAGSCADRAPLGVELDEPAHALLSPLTKLLECPAPAGWSESVVIGPDGFRFNSGGVRLTVPPGAVPAPTEFTITVPASKYVEVRIIAKGWDGYVFQQPVTIAMSYDRCLNPSLLGSLAIWYIDGESKDLIQYKGGSDDRPGRRLSFRTDHLSGYAIAN
jgi:hypothetical protein